MKLIPAARRPVQVPPPGRSLNHCPQSPAALLLLLVLLLLLLLLVLLLLLLLLLLVLVLVPVAELLEMAICLRGSELA